MSFPCYFLLYKHNNSPYMWVVNTKETSENLNKNLENFKSEYEKYYIIKDMVPDIEKALNFKRFTIFKKNKYQKIIFET